MNKALIFAELYRRMGIAIFSQNPNGYFSPFAPLPDWFLTLYQNRQAPRSMESNEYYLGATFPFIENFLYDAEAVWYQSTDDSVRSGLWTEEIDEEEEIYLEAIAIRLESENLLLITNESTHFEVRQKVFQNARNIALKNEELETSIARHQRQLKQRLEDFYQQGNDFNQLKAELDDNRSAVLFCNERGDTEFFNQALVNIYAAGNDKELPPSLLDNWILEAKKQYPEINRVVGSGHHWEGEFKIGDTAGNQRWIRLIISPIKEADSVTHYLCIANDISDLRLSSSELERMMQIDATTRLPNRRHFWKHLDRTFSEHALSSKPLALLYIDLDYFKQINDELGPSQADFLLSTVATRLKRSLKQGDFVAHLGGDEFAVILHGIGDTETVEHIAERIRLNILREVSFGDLNVSVTASIGMAIYPQNGLHPKQLVLSADYAMYHAKELGRNRCQLFSSQCKTRFKKRLYVEQQIKQALEKNEFELYFQPQVCTGKSTAHRIEALVRWNHPKHGIIAPADFIDVAEETGLIHPLGLWVIETSCRQIQALLKDGFRVQVAVNVSARQFMDPQFVNKVRHIIKQTGADPNQLEFEVTESIFVENIPGLVEMLEEFKQMGITLSLDDFGTGYSSLSYLRNLPVDNIKIDKSFIQELPDNKHCRTIVESVIHMAHDLSMEVVAEGVENAEQLDFIKRRGCDYVQGYFFHAPLSFDELERFYRSLTA